MKAILKVVGGAVIAAALSCAAAKDARADGRYEYHGPRYECRESRGVHWLHWNAGYVFGYRSPVVYYAPPPVCYSPAPVVIYTLPPRRVYYYPGERHCR